MEKLTPAIDLRRGDKLQTVLLIWYESRDEDTAGNRFQQALQSSRSGAEHPEIVAAIEDFKPTAPIGVSTVGKLFSRELVETMSRTNPRPIIFALSNPIEKHECLAEEVYARSGGKVAYAGGVQFPPVYLGGQTFLHSQAHNLDIFPAVGMAINATNAKRVTDEMFIETAHAVADQVSSEAVEAGDALPAAGEHPGGRGSDTRAGSPGHLRLLAWPASIVRPI